MPVVTTLIRGLYNIPRGWSGCVATIGNFDGVHLGHQALLAKVNEEAKRRQVPSVVITFEPQPLEFFASGKPAVPRLTRLREKFHALAACGIHHVLVLRFNEWLAALTADQFIDQVLNQGLKVQHVIVGDDFRFGKARLGDIAFLKQAGGFTAEDMPSVMLLGERVSSTRVRLALVAGEHEVAERLLGRPYSMEGRIVHGDKLGRYLGFPTANIYLHRQMTPVHGIYVVRMHGLSEKALPGVANVGIRPTVGGTRTLLEVHLFDFDHDIYGRQVTVEFCQKLRDEEHYDSLDILRDKIAEDALKGRAYFADKHY